MISNSRTSSDDYIEIPNNGALDVRYSMTLMAWLCLNKIQDGPIIEYTIDNGIGTHLWIYLSKLYVSILLIVIIIIIAIYIAQFPFITCSKALHIVIVLVIVNNASMGEPEKVSFETLLEGLTRCRILQVLWKRIP